MASSLHNTKALIPAQIIDTTQVTSLRVSTR
jgi:hypothetical protein